MFLSEDEPYAYQWHQRHRLEFLRETIADMTTPVECAHCSHVYDMGRVTVTGRYTDCSMWRCPGCNQLVDDRGPGWGRHDYTELRKDLL